MEEEISIYKCTGCFKNFNEKEMKGINIIDFDQSKLGKKPKPNEKIKGFFICVDCIKAGKGYIYNVDCYICDVCGITTMVEEVKRKKRTKKTIEKIKEPYIVYEDEANVIGTYRCLHCQGYFQ